MTDENLVLSKYYIESEYRLSFSNLIIYLILAFGALLMATPLLWAFVTSLKSLNEIFTNSMNLVPEKWLWSNYLDVFKAVPFQTYFLNTLKITMLVTLGTLIISSMAAYAFARLRFPGRDYLFFFYLTTLMIPQQVTLAPAFILMKWLGLIDTHLSLILLGIFNSFNAYGTFLLRQFFLGIPHELEEAAMLDGCGFFKIFIKIILPLSKPGLATLTIFTMLNSWNDYLYPLIFINSEKLRTLTLGLAIFRGDLDVQWNLVMAAALLSVLPIVIAFLLLRRFFVEGIALSGIKG